MGHPVFQGADLPDHLTPEGDRVAVRVVVNVLASGALTIQAPDDPVWVLALLEHAIDAVRARTRPGALVIPPKDVQLP